MIGWLLLVIALAELCLGLFFLFRYQKNQATFWYGLFAISAALYVGSNGLGYADALISGQMAEQLAWIGGMNTAFFFLAFSYSFPLPVKNNKEVLPWVVWPAGLFTLGILFTDVFIGRQVIPLFGEGYTTDAGPLFWFMVTTFGLYWVWSVTNFIRRARVSDGVFRRNIQLILAGIFCSLAVSSVFDIYMPLTNVTRFGYVGSLFTSVWLGFTSYIILKK